MIHHTLNQQLMKTHHSNNAIKILFAEDHQAVVESFVRYVQDSEDIKIVCIVGTVRDVFEQLQTQKFDVIILDLHLPQNRLTEKSQLAGYEILDFIKENNIDINSIILSSSEDSSYISKAKAKGAKGYLSKKVDSSEFREAIRIVGGSNKEYIEKNLLSKMNFTENTTLIVLTDKERSILNHISNGLNSREIGNKLSLANDTVRDYRHSLIKKFGAINSANLVKIALEKGYLIQT
jgi:two-component system, NarL family, nitrate/nitrite response regulator NarL